MSTVDVNKFGSKGWTPHQLSSQKGKAIVINDANNSLGFEDCADVYC